VSSEISVSCGGAVLEAGGLAAILDAMQLHTSAAVQEYGCMALSNLFAGEVDD
jgi:hypothetical protein